MRTPSRIAVATLCFGFLVSSFALFLIGCNSESNSSNGSTTFNGLVVADLRNSRVLLYNSPLSNDQIANVVLGQTGFTTATMGSTANTMGDPAEVITDASGNLYVTDGINCRALQFKPPFTTGMNASLVLGQPNFTTAICSAGASARTLGNSTNSRGVFGMAFDAQGNLWVADSGNCRVLEYQPPFSSGMAAVLAIGQPDLNTTSPAAPVPPTRSNFGDPNSLAFDGSGNLWVSDMLNSRVLEFAPPFVTGMQATLVIGQAGFGTGYPNQLGPIAANTLLSPGGLTFDSAGNLWVSDTLNNRILEFQPPFATDMPATLVLGQDSFVTGDANQDSTTPTAASLSGPFAVAFDTAGKLYVSDAENNRVLLFFPPFSKGMSAALVIGQPNSTSAASGTTATTLTLPEGLALAGSLK